MEAAAGDLKVPYFFAFPLAHRARIALSAASRRSALGVRFHRALAACCADA